MAIAPALQVGETDLRQEPPPTWEGPSGPAVSRLSCFVGLGGMGGSTGVSLEYDKNNNNNSHRWHSMVP